MELAEEGPTILDKDGDKMMPLCCERSEKFFYFVSF
jgi:hypothetical protein